MLTNDINSISIFLTKRWSQVSNQSRDFLGLIFVVFTQVYGSIDRDCKNEKQDKRGLHFILKLVLGSKILD